METHIGVGVGKYLEKEFENAKDSLWIATQSEESNVLIRKYSLDETKDGLSHIKINHKVVSTKETPMIHVKLYVVDGKTAIIGSPNLGENHFWKYAEYIWVLREPELVKITMKDYETLWSSYNDSKMELSNTKRKSKNIIRGIRRKM